MGLEEQERQNPELSLGTAPWFWGPPNAGTALLLCWGRGCFELCKASVAGATAVTHAVSNPGCCTVLLRMGLSMAMGNPQPAKRPAPLCMLRASVVRSLGCSGVSCCPLGRGRLCLVLQDTAAGSQRAAWARDALCLPPALSALLFLRQEEQEVR